MIEHILHETYNIDLSQFDVDQLPLLYFMACDDEEIFDKDGEWIMERQYSPDWRLVVFENDVGILYDFNGWPGDNEAGVGLYRPKAGGSDDVLVYYKIFTNSDMDLESEYADHTLIVSSYITMREKYYPQDEDE